MRLLYVYVRRQCSDLYPFCALTYTCTCLVQCTPLRFGTDRKFYFDGKVIKKPAVDMIFPVPDLFDPPSHIPPWNALSPSFLHVLMAFAHQYLHDDGAILMFYPDFINKIKKCAWIS